MFEENGTCLSLLFSSEKVIGKTGKVAIFMHRTPDPDSIASAVGISHVINKVFGFPCDIFYAGEISHKQNQTMCNVLGFVLSEINEYYKKKDQYIVNICVDCTIQNIGIPENEKIEIDLVIDHHRITVSDSMITDIRQVGACSSIVWDIMMSHNCMLNADDVKKIATAMIIGIRTDTNDLLSNSVSELDFKAYQFLLSIADFQKVQLITNYSKPKYFYEYFANTFCDGVVVNNTFVASVGFVTEAKRDVIPYIADEMVRMEGISTSVVFGVINDRISVSVRSDDAALDLKAFCKRIFGENSGARYGAGGASIPLGFLSGIAGDPEEVRQKTIDAVKAKLIHLIGKEVKNDR